MRGKAHRRNQRARGRLNRARAESLLATHKRIANILAALPDGDDLDLADAEGALANILEINTAAIEQDQLRTQPDRLRGMVEAMREAVKNAEEAPDAEAD